MAHSCPDCDALCHCNGDIDDIEYEDVGHCRHCEETDRKDYDDMDDDSPENDDV